MKQVTCATCIRFDGKLLLAHSTGLPWDQWNFPKGIADPGEAHKDAAVRELFEETTLKISADKLIDLGVFAYNDEKDIHVFLYDAPSEIDAKTLKCESMFFCPKKQAERPECDSFRMVPFEKLHAYFAPRMKSLYFEKLQHIIEKIDESNSYPSR